MRVLVQSLVVGMGLMVSQAGAGARAAYTVQDLGPVQARAVNTAGVVAGANATGTEAVRVQPRRPPVGLGFLPDGNFSYGNGIHGQAVVGYSSTGTFGLQTHAFVHTPKGGMQDLGTLTGNPADFSAATGINAAQTISGYATRPVPGGGGDERRAVVVLGGQFTDLDTLGGPEALAHAVNDDGEIVGQSQTSNGVWHATLWPMSGLPVDLDTLGSTMSQALGINRHQDVVGWAVLAGNIQQGFHWTAATGMQALPPLPGDAWSEATGINDTGLIVGTSGAPAEICCEDEARAVVWVEAQPVDLNTLVRAPRWQLRQATAINAAGQIAGFGFREGEPRGFLLTPTLPMHRDPKARVRLFVRALLARLAQERHAGR